MKALYATISNVYSSSANDNHGAVIMGQNEFLPDNIRGLFWDCDPATVSLTKHRSFVIGRILDHGDWNAVSWLRKEIGDEAIRDWLEQKQGGQLGPRKLRFWELILGLPDEMVEVWISRRRSSSWERRQST